MLKRISKILFFVIFGKQILRAITRHAIALVFDTVDIYLRIQNGESIEKIREANKAEHDDTLRGAHQRAAIVYRGRSMRYRRYGAEKWADFNEHLARVLRKRVEELN
ncbi:MAG: hypothetical protein HLX46_02585 [Corynebacterium sp.]|uniref:hypothetical protein n=1 Tax=Corynebacterium sp. TaxID=1720 RepID=UPI0017DF2955|nr:hypothetical protein [Corynebacterium sp.]NWO15737.1 hypothetical protein [Corynebacterium sp.]